MIEGGVDREQPERRGIDLTVSRRTSTMNSVLPLTWTGRGQAAFARTAVAAPMATMIFMR